MVLNFMMKKSIKYLLFAVVLLMLSCEEKIMIVNCSDCTTDEPTTASLHLKLEPQTINNTLVKVYRGVLEDSILIDSFTTDSEEYSYTANLNTKYTFTAEYFSQSGKTIIAVNSAYPKVRYEKQQCDNPCFYVYDNKVNLRIKYH
jgi:hypothetical protein